jgi:hypothetical protein
MIAQRSSADQSETAHMYVHTYVHSHAHIMYIVYEVSHFEPVKVSDQRLKTPLYS